MDVSFCLGQGEIGTAGATGPSGPQGQRGEPGVNGAVGPVGPAVSRCFISDSQLTFLSLVTCLGKI